MLLKPGSSKPKYITITFWLTVLCLFYSFSVYNKPNTNKYNYIEGNTKKILSAIDRSLLLEDSVFDQKTLKKLQSNYFALRVYYKHIECFIEYCSPFDTKYFINGPLVKKSDLEIGTRIVDPHGFQVIEEQLFGVDSVDTSLLFIELNLLKESFKAFNNKMRGYVSNEAIIVGVESRTSTPVRIPRDKFTLQHVQIKNLYHCAEGAGYDGGIVSAAMDGVNCVNAINLLP